MLNTIYNKAHKITENDKYLNKYTYLAFNNIIEARYLSINDVITGDVKLTSYIVEHNKVLLIPHKLNGVVISLLLKPMLGPGNPLTLTTNNHIPFNVGNFSKDFKYGDPIIIVEGVGDLGGLLLLNNNLNIISLNTSSLPKKQYDIVAAMTNKVLLLTDNDSTGETNAKLMQRTFRKNGVDAEILTQYNSFKDTGDLVDLLLDYKKTNNIYSKERLIEAQKYYKTLLDIYYRR